MRLPVVSSISTKNGTSNKNSRLTNCLRETKKDREFAVVRPGLDLISSSSGAAGGLVAFNNTLVALYGTAIYAGGGSGDYEKIDPTNGIAQAFSDGTNAIIGGDWLTPGDLVIFDGDNYTAPFTPSGDVPGPVWGGSYVQPIVFGATKAFSLQLDVDYYPMNLVESTNYGVSWTITSALPAAPDSFVLWSTCLTYFGGVLYLIAGDADSGLGEYVCHSNDEGLTWSAWSAISSPLQMTNTSTSLVCGSTVVICDNVNNWFLTTTNFVNFSSISMSVTAQTLGYWNGTKAIGYPVNGDPGEIYALDIGTGDQTLMQQYIPPFTPIYTNTAVGLPFNIGDSYFVVGGDGTYRMTPAGSLTNIGTIQSGFYDFAQGPL